MSEKALPSAITGGVAVIGVGMASIFFMIHQATTDLNEMRTELDKLKTSIEVLPQLQSDASNMNMRINELDSGMLAMAKMLKLDGAELSRLMNNELTGSHVPPATVAVQAPAIQMKPRSAPAAAPAQPAELAETPAWAITAESDSSAAVQEGKKPLTIADVDSILVERISDNWNVPPGNIDELRTELKLTLDRDGSMKAVEVITSSGNKVFDDSAVSAIKRINAIPEVALLADDLYRAGYQSRSIVFTPDLGG